MTYYRKKLPIRPIVEARQWDGSEGHAESLIEWVGKSHDLNFQAKFSVDELRVFESGAGMGNLACPILRTGHWLVKSDTGFESYSPAAFLETYDAGIGGK